MVEAAAAAAKATSSAESNVTKEESPAPPLEEEAEKSEESEKASPKTEKESKEEQSKEEKEEDEEAKKKKEEEEAALREKYKDWPMKNISEIHANDVLYGRGGGTNHHPGNKRYRKMVEDRKVDYVNSKRLDKPLVALDIIREWRKQLPPGRFLKLDEKTKLYHDVGDKKAREKTSQALREKAPQIRKQQEEERQAKELVDHDEGSVNNKSTRFAEGTNPNDGAREGGLSKVVLARDHSLGREYLKPDEAIDLGGFSWQDPFRSGNDGRTSSQGSYGPPPPGDFHPGARMGSQSSMGGPPPPPSAAPYPYASHGSMGGPPPPQAYPAHATSGEERHYRYTTSGRYESWGSVGPPPPMPGFGFPQHSGGWGRDPSCRENSLGQNPLPHASIGHSAPPYGAAFDGRGPSGQWGPPPPGYPHPPMPGQPYYHYSGGPPPPGAYPPPPGREYSGGPPPPPPQQQRSNPGTPTRKDPPSPRYEVDPAVASTWSGGKTDEIGKTWSGSSEEADGRRRSPRSEKAKLSPKSIRKNGSLPRPDIVKRMTSNQNETPETKPDLCGPSVKRCALNRDQSAVANRLKEQYLPGYRADTSEKFDREMRMLSSNLESSTLGGDSPPGAKPTPLALGERTSTLDQIAMDLAVKPEPLSFSSRTSTIEALALELDDVPLDQSDLAGNMALDEEKGSNMERPPPLGMNDRLTTMDILDIVKEPIPDDDMALVSGKRQVV